MSKLLEVYKCGLCGSMVEVIHGGQGILVCCNQPMTLQNENTVDAAKEKHVPVIEKTAKGYKVKVGAVPHPMEDKHYIEWVQLCAEGGFSLRKFLKPGEAPEAEFETGTLNNVEAREYCNLHGLWKAS